MWSDWVAAWDNDWGGPEEWCVSSSWTKRWTYKYILCKFCATSAVLCSPHVAIEKTMHQLQFMCFTVATGSKPLEYLNVISFWCVECTHFSNCMKNLQMFWASPASTTISHCGLSQITMASHAMHICTHWRIYHWAMPSPPFGPSTTGRKGVQGPSTKNVANQKSHTLLSKVAIWS